MLNWLALIWVCIGLIVAGFTMLILASLAGIGFELLMSFLELRRERKGLNDGR